MQVYIWEVLIYHVCNIAEIFIRWSTHWFKVIIHIPEEWKGEEVHFRWNSASEAMVIIYYIPGYFYYKTKFTDLCPQCNM